MRRVWAAVLAVWATIAVVAVLAWTNAPVQPAAQPAPVVYTVNGKRVVALPAGAPHATTRTSPPAASTPPAAGTGLVAAAPASASAPAHATTRTS